MLKDITLKGIFSIFPDRTYEADGLFKDLLVVLKQVFI